MVAGKSGVGKTSLVRTLDMEKTLFMDLVLVMPPLRAVKSMSLAALGKSAVTLHVGGGNPR